MERSEISHHEVRIYQSLKTRPQEWLTNKEIAGVSGVNERTVRLHTLRFVKLGMLDLAEVFPAHRFRWSAKAERRNKSYEVRLENAIEVFGPCEDSKKKIKQEVAR